MLDFPTFNPQPQKAFDLKMSMLSIYIVCSMNVNVTEQRIIAKDESELRPTYINADRLVTRALRLL